MFVFVMEPISHFIMSINVIFGPEAVKKIGPIQNELCQKDKTICIYKLKMKYIDIYLSRSIKFFTILAH